MKPAPNNDRPLLPWRVRTSMVLRSLLIQVTNNFERMQSLGFVYALWPALTVAYRDEGERRAAARRHLEFFNTQPYLANSILGVVAHAELVERGPGLEENVARVKRAMMGVFGALGDDLFWAGLMPASALIALTVYAVRPDLAIAGLVAAFVIYNVFHLWSRIRLFDLSLQYGRRVTRVLRKLRLPSLVLVIKAAGAFLVGGFVALAVWRAAGTGVIPRVGVLAFGAALVLTYLLQRLGIKPGWCWFIIGTAATAAGALLRLR